MTKIKLTNFCDSSRFSSPMHVLHYLQIRLTSSKGLKTVAIDKENYLALRRLGYTGESFNTVIGRLIHQAKQRGGVNE
jgi:hypothetical protein